MGPDNSSSSSSTETIDQSMQLSWRHLSQIPKWQRSQQDEKLRELKEYEN